MHGYGLPALNVNNLEQVRAVMEAADRVNSPAILQGSSGMYVERIFQTHSPLIDSIKVEKKADVRKAKLYYMRGRTGKAARIKENV